MWAVRKCVASNAAKMCSKGVNPLRGAGQRPTTTKTREKYEICSVRLRAKANGSSRK